MTTKLTEGERSLLQRRLRPDTMGGFMTDLWRTIEVADSTNLDRLYKGFPSHVVAYRNYAHTEGWWEKLKRRANFEDSMVNYTIPPHLRAHDGG